MQALRDNTKRMKILNIYVRYRLPLGFILLVAAGIVHYFSGFWPSFILYLMSVVSIAGHFLFGPLRLIQEYMESGDLEGAEKILATVRFPGLLIKPVRSVYFFLKSNIALMHQNFDESEALMKKSIALGMPMKETEGAAYFQLGSIAMQKNNFRQAEDYLRKALKVGLPDKENQAAAYLQMSSIYMNKREFRAAKDYFRRAKALNPSTPQIADQIKQMEKYISRMPG